MNQALRSKFASILYSSIYKNSWIEEFIKIDNMTQGLQDAVSEKSKITYELVQDWAF